MIKKKKKTTNTINKKAIAKEYIAGIIHDKKEMRDFSSSLFGSTGSGRAYKGTRNGKHFERWEIFSGTADQDLQCGELQELRVRCRQMDKDNPIAEGTIITFQEMAVGHGPFIHARYPGNTEIQDNIQKVLDKWVLKCDSTQEKTLNQICRNIVSGACDNGDVLITLPMNKDLSGIQTVIKLIEADRITTPSDKLNSPVRHGVQYNPVSEAIEGYYVKNIGETESTHSYNSWANPTSDKYKFLSKMKNGRLSAWLFKRPSSIERPSQTRQVPLMSSAIHDLQQMEQLIDANVIGERVAACIMGAITSNDISGLVDSYTRDESQGKLEDRFGAAYSRLQPGTIIPLKAGEELKLINPQRSGNEVVDIVRNLCLNLSMKVRIPYPVLFLDLKGTSFSSYRGGILEARRMLNGWRTNLSDIVVSPIIETVLIESILRGMIPGLENENPYEIVSSLFKIAWPAWGYVDPTKEVSADVEAINNKLTSRQRVIREHGADAFEVLEEQFIYRQKEIELEKKYGFKLTSLTDKTVPVNSEIVPDPEEDEEQTNNNNEEVNE